MNRRSTPVRLGLLATFVTSMALAPSGTLANPEQSTSVTPEAARVLGLMSDAFSAVASDVKPYVVSITTETEVTRSADAFPGLREFFGDRFFGNPHEGEAFRQQGLGSGLIVSPDGVILTNNHVAGEADELTVQLHDGRVYPAKLVGADRQSDIAVIKVEVNESLPSATLGSSEELRVGDWVIAVGSPFHLEQTVTAGIVSAKSRSGVNLTEYEDFIQTDAAINPGNSGGPLVNLQGQVVGINTAIATRSGGYQGIGFAIPIDMAKAIMNDLLTEGRAIRGWLGVTIQNLDEDLAESVGLSHPYGALVENLDDRGSAGEAGIQKGDVIVRFQGEEIRDTRQLMNKVAMTRPGTNAEVVVSREGKQKTIWVKLKERPTELQPVVANRETPDFDDPFGMVVRPLTSDLADQLGTEMDHGGVVVESVERGSVAEEKGLRPGDVIREMKRNRLSSVPDYREYVDAMGSGETVLLLVERDGRTRFVALRKP